MESKNYFRLPLLWGPEHPHNNATFYSAGVGRVGTSPYPLPFLSIHGETAEDIAMQVDMGLEMAAAFSKSESGPFTDAGEVELYLAQDTLNDKEKQQRLKLEVQFAGECTTLLSKVDPLFWIKSLYQLGRGGWRIWRGPDGLPWQEELQILLKFQECLNKLVTF